MKNSNLIQHNLNEVYNLYKNYAGGLPASYIPELAKANPNHFAICIITASGEVYSVGDTNIEFTLQSTSKPLVYGLALSLHGIETVHSKVGVEPTGEAFNSIIELEEKSHRPFNPMINSGAIAITSLLTGASKNEKLSRIIQLFESYCNRPLSIDNEVYESENKTANRNRAIAYLMKHFDVLENDIDETLELYFKQCSIKVNTIDLGFIAATLANNGLQPVSKKQILEPQYISKLLSLMFTCGMYDSTGEWAFNIGLPAKSGVSGAIFAVVPGKMGIAAFSPPIDEKGHSIRSMKAIQDLTIRLGLNIFSNGDR